MTLVITVILVATIILLVTEKLPYDLTALAVMVVLVVAGLLTPDQALAGFSNAAPITIAFLFVVSTALLRTGALDFITQRIIRLSKGRQNRLFLILLFTVGGFSSFVNNTPVVLLFVSIVMAVCCEYGLSPSRFLMPLSFISILAGTSTLVGTSTNIIVSDLAVDHGLPPLAMFELTPLGAPLAMAGAVFLFFAAPRLLKARKEPVCEVNKGGASRYLSELQVPSGSPLVGQEARVAFSERFPDIELFEVFRDVEVLDPDREDFQIEAGDVLLVRATAQQLSTILNEKCAVLLHGTAEGKFRPSARSPVVVEILVPPNSDSVGRTLEDLLASQDAHIKVIGVKRHWKHYQAGKFRDLVLTVGDLILAEVPPDHLETVRAGGELLVIEHVHHTLVNRKKAPIAMAVFVLMIASTAFGLTSLIEAAMAAALVMILTGCVSIREAYRSVDVRILILIVGTLALGRALTASGAADVYARTILSTMDGLSPSVVLSAFILLTSVLSLFISNNATAALLVPIAISTAGALGVDPRPFVIGICFGASACYATPIGYQTNLLVYGPGGYRFTDYLKLGIPLNIAVWAAASIFIPIIWPF